MSFHWNTAVIADALRAALPDCTIIVNGPGGDWDTEGIEVMLNAYVKDHSPEGHDFKTWQYDASVSVFGMSPNAAQGDTVFETPNDVDVEIVFACESQKEGMANASADDMILCGQATKVLEGLGVSHVNSQGWKVYF